MNMTIGTVAYSAPEQLLGEEIDGRADEYALAATPCEMLTGSSLFVGSNPAVLIARHLNSEPPALADTRPELAKLDPILRAGLAKRPTSASNDVLTSPRHFASRPPWRQRLHKQSQRLPPQSDERCPPLHRVVTRPCTARRRPYSCSLLPFSS